jgi:ABC-type multidrug transport system ATPase subunit
MAEQQAWLRIAGLGKAYGAHVVLEGVDLELGRGRLVAVTGPNGAGKSTLLGCICGTLRHAGEVLVDGAPISSAGGRVAYLPQRVRMPATATVTQILDLFRSLAGDQPQRVPIPADFLPPPDRRMAQLSGGQAQRVALAAALTGSPELILLDEPFANLDEAGRDATLDLIRQHAAQGALVLVASPTVLELLGSIDLVVHVADRGLSFTGVVGDYLGRLSMTIWVQRNGTPPAAFEGLGNELTVRHLAEWTAIDCQQHLAAGVIAALAEGGVPADKLMIADRLANGRSSPPDLEVAQ